MPTPSANDPNIENDTALLERARLALQSLQFQEQAARYRAARAALQEAIADAEAGDRAPLHAWFDARNKRMRWDPAESRFEHSDGDEPFDPATLPGKPIDRRAEVASPWALMQRSATERAYFWLGTDLRPSTVPTTEPTEPHVVESTEIALDKVPLDAAMSNVSSMSLGAAIPLVSARNERKRKPWWVSPHVYISLIIHALLLVAFSLWIITTVQLPIALSIVSGTIDSDEVLTESTMEMPATLDVTSETALSPTSMDSASLPIALPTVSALDVGMGPTIGDAATATRESSHLSAATAGTRWVEGAEFFGSKAVGNTFVFVVDCSPSMLRDGAFDTAKLEILKSLGMLKPKQRFFVTFFGKEIVTMQFRGQPPEQYAIRATPENLEKTQEWIARVPIQKDGRAPIEALREAIQMQPDGIFLLFDGDTKVDEWTSRVRQGNRVDDFVSKDATKVPIHVVHFFREEFEKEMRTLASENGGTYRFVPRPDNRKRGGP